VPPLTLLHAVGAQVAAVNPEQQIYSNVEDLDSWISDEPEWQQVHLAAWLMAVFILAPPMWSLLYGVHPSDPPTFFAVLVVLVGVALLATYIPARRATEVDSMVALRCERNSSHPLRKSPKRSRKKPRLVRERTGRFRL
jgi:hypothetical protein